MSAPVRSAGANIGDIRRALALLVEPGAVVELRVPNAGRAGAASGYFDDLDALAAAAARWSGRAPGVYLTLNPVAPALLARAVNRVREHARETTSDCDILRRVRLMFDFDSERPPGISATEDEHAAALDRAREAREWLCAELGWPAPILADSGNGGHLVFGVDLPNHDATTALLKRVLEALAVRFNDERVKVDLGVFNAARIWKVYGTVAAKGDSTADRPHRLARILDAPARLEVVPRECLEAFAALAPPTPSPPSRGTRGEYTLDAVERALDARGLTVGKRKSWNGGTLVELEECPWHGAEHSRTARVILHASGAVSAGCFHKSCAGLGWRDLRDALGLAAGVPSANVPGSAALVRPWDAAQPAPAFIAAGATEAPDDWLDKPLLARGAVTEIFAPRGIGKSLVAMARAVALAREGRRVLYLDRDNPPRVVRQRMQAFGADDTPALRVMTRSHVPPLTDAGAWTSFPYGDYDVVFIDSLDAATEGVGEQDSARPSRAIAVVLDIARRAGGPAFLIPGNTDKRGAHGRGSGVIEDRGDIVFEVRDVTDFTPSGKKAWWLELPPAGRDAWAERAARRKRRKTYRLAFINSKCRGDEEPEPFVYELDLSGERWSLRDVTAELVAAGEAARDRARQEAADRGDRAAAALAVEVRRREAAGEDRLVSERGAVPFLTALGLTRKAARALIAERAAKDWRLVPVDGRSVVLAPADSTGMAAQSGAAGDPHESSGFDESNCAGRMDTGRRNPDTPQAANDAAPRTPSIAPPAPSQQAEVLEL